MHADQAPGDVHESAGQVQEKDAPEQEAATAIIEEVKHNYQFTASYEQAQRLAEDEELEFEGVDMWGKDARDARAETVDASSGAKIPAKPTLSVNLFDQTISQVVNEARQAKLSVSVKPKTGIANTKTAGYFKGLLRSIQVESGALSVRLWALERAAKVGRGGYLLTADYANDGDFDLDLMLERILDYKTVYWDPYGVKVDRKDAGWALITDWLPRRERERRWPTKPIIAPADAFQKEDDDWFAADGADQKNERCRVVTYYKKKYKRYQLGYHPEFGQGWIGADLPKHVKEAQPMPPQYAASVLKGDPGTRLRDVDVPSVMIYVIDGTQELERRPWHGRYIPIIEVVGKEYFVKGKRRWKGIVANGMDILRAINVLLSAAVELAGTMPRAPYIMAAGQDDGFEDQWDDAAIKNFIRLYYNPVDVNGTLAPPPQRQQREPEVQGLMLLLRMMHEMYHAVTGSVAPQMRAVNPHDRSGKAIEALQRQGQAGTSNYLDNLATISMNYECECLVDSIPQYYDTPGRVLRVMGEEDDAEQAIMLKTPFIRDKDGNPQAVPCPDCQGSGIQKSAGETILNLATLGLRAPSPCKACEGTKIATKENMPPEWQGKAVEYVDLSEGAFKVQPSIDRNFQTKQEEALAGMEKLAAAVPEMVPMYADLWVRAMGFSGANAVADRIKAQNPALQTPEDMEGVPPAVIAKFQAMQQQHQEVMMALEEAQKLLETDAVKQAGQKELAAIKGAIQQQVEKLKLQARIMETREKGTVQQSIVMMQGRIESMQQAAEQRHEIILQLLKEKGAKEEERHSVGLHDAAARAAEERAELSNVSAEAREEGRNVRAERREEDREVRSGSREEGAAVRSETREEGRELRAETREEGRSVRAETREEGREARAFERERKAEKTNDKP